MSNFQPLILCDTDKQPFRVAGEFDFVEQTFDLEPSGVEHTLDSMVSHIVAEPKALFVHLQRIYFCYNQELTEDLFASLVDLLIVLEGKGRDLSRKMILGAKSKLSVEDFAVLKQGLSLSEQDVKLLKGNKYSVFSLGLVGTPLLIEKLQDLTLPVYDPIDIARDFIAYSQLDAAIETLEQAILQDVERQALHDDLLELYKVTHSVERFTKMAAQLSVQMTTLPAAWHELKGFFNEG